jgi:hypothetical protein
VPDTGSLRPHTLVAAFERALMLAAALGRPKESVGRDGNASGIPQTLWDLCSVRRRNRRYQVECAGDGLAACSRFLAAFYACHVHAACMQAWGRPERARLDGDMQQHMHQSPERWYFKHTGRRVMEIYFSRETKVLQILCQTPLEYMHT